MKLTTRLKRAWARIQHNSSAKLSKGPNDPQTLHQQLVLYNHNNLEELDLHTDTEATIYTLSPSVSTDAAVLSIIHQDLLAGRSIAVANREIDPKERALSTYFLDSKGNYVDTVHMMGIVKSQLLEIVRLMTTTDKVKDNNRVMLVQNLPAFHRYMESHLRLTYTGPLRTQHHVTKPPR